MMDNQVEAPLRILLIDDEEIIHESVGKGLERIGNSVFHALNAREGLRIFEEEKIDIVITDIRMPGMDGIELLHRLKQRPKEVEVIMITGHGEMDSAIECLRAGACDFLNKPIRVKEMSACLQRTRRYQEVRREKERIQQRLEILQRSQEGPQEGEEFIGESQAIQSTRELIARVARAEQTTVLITGESGTGKELVARAIHRQSARGSGPFVSINCAAISENLLESELFGHEKGAFTDAREQKKGIFELAEGGTVFLDEIGDMSFSAQAKILRVLEERRIRRVGGNREIAVDVRLISATNQDLQARVNAGRFRQDLYFRLNVFTLPLSPLRERGDDVLLLAYHFLQQYTREFRKEIAAIDPAAQEVLRRYRFPGNVRELRNVIERAIILCEGSSLRVEDFQVSFPGEGKSVVLQEDALDSVEFPQTVKELRQLIEQVIAAHESSGSRARDVRVSATEKGESVVPEEGSLDLVELEKRAVQAALRRAHGKKVEAASYLGINLDALNRRIRKYGIRIE